MSDDLDKRAPMRDKTTVHQKLYHESRSSLAGEYPEVDVQLRVSKIRLLTPGVAVVHVRSEFHLKSHSAKKTKNLITAVMQKQEGG